MDGTLESPILDVEITQQPTPPPRSGIADMTGTPQSDIRNTKRMDIDDETNGPDMLSPMSAEGEKHEATEMRTIANPRIPSPSLGYDFSNIRVSKVESGDHGVRHTNKT